MKPFDVSKFRKSITKDIAGISIGFNDPTTWISTGNYALNYLVSSDFFKGLPLGKSTIFSGESGSGKSFFASGGIVREAQKMGIFVVLIDSENALDESWLQALGVDTDPEKILRISASMVDDVAKIISDFMKEFKTNYADAAKEDRPKVLFVVDSIGMLMTPTDVAQFERGEMKGDMGRKPKALKALVTNVTNMFGEYDVGLVATNHSYASQDPFSPDPIMSGGSGLVYAASIVIAMVKRKLKEDVDGNKTSEVNGIRSAIKIMKSRYAQPFQTMEIKIPYDQGMDPFSGLVDFFEAKGIFIKDGNKLRYTDKSGVEHKHFRKQITNELLMQMMLETKDDLVTRSKTALPDEVIDEETGEISSGISEIVEVSEAK
ncbi:MAG: ATPase domain-containing protein [Crocinitomicaceae bacterium]